MKGTASAVRKRLAKGSFARNVLVLTVGTAVGQAIPVLISPLVSRMYTPEDLGVFALFMSVTMILGVSAAGRFEMAVMLPRKDEDAANLIALSSVIILAAGSVFLLLLLLYGAFAGALRPAWKAPGWMGLAVAAALAMAFVQTFTMWLNRKNRYRDMTVNKIIQAVTAAVLMLAIGWLRRGPAGLMWSYLISQAVAASIMGFQTVRQIRANRLAVSVPAMRAQAARYREFPKVNAVHALTDQVQANGVTFMIRALFTQKVLGWYGYTMRVLRTPLLFVGRSVSQALYQKASEVLHEGKDLRALVKRTMRQLAWIGLPVFGLIFLTAPPLFGFVFGENWREAGEYARLLSPWLYMNFIMSSLSQLPLLVGEQRKNFLISVGYNLLLLGLILAGYWMGDIKKGFLLVSIFMSLYIACMLRWYLVISGKKMTDSYPIEPFPPPDDAA